MLASEDGVRNKRDALFGVEENIISKKETSCYQRGIYTPRTSGVHA